MTKPLYHRDMCAVHKAAYSEDREAVLFVIRPAGERGLQINAEISEEALLQVFGASPGRSEILWSFGTNLDLIEQAALQQFRRAPYEPVRLDSDDFVVPEEFASDFMH